ncbi:MAG TPA: xanthine dehydrogenase family protein molybdopterin-binding subunit [Trebonia sp.]
MTATPYRGKAELRSYLGKSELRREDLRFLTGTGRYVDDIVLPGTLHACFVRSQVAHARLRDIDTARARAAGGVVAVVTAADLGDALPTIPCDWILPMMPGIPVRYALARDRVRFVGEAVAVVVAETPAQAADAAALVEVDYEPLPVVTNQEEAYQAGAPQLHDEFPGNLVFDWPMGRGDFETAVAESDIQVDLRLINQPVSASPLECRAVIADYHVGTDQVTLYTSTQAPHVVRKLLCEATGWPENLVRVIAPDVGGGFGAKLCLYPEDAVLPLLSRHVGRPVKWVETRSENLTSTSHGRDHVELVSVAATKDGKILGLKVETFANLGAYVSGMGVGIPAVFALMVPGCYDIEHVSCLVHGVLTNTATTETYRGAGRPEASYLMERAIEALGARLGIDPVEIRRRNYVRPEQFPYQNGCGFIMDTGDYEASLDLAVRNLDYAAARDLQQKAREEGRLVGIGVSSYVEFTGHGELNTIRMLGFDRPGWEHATVEVSRNGKITVQSGLKSTGQGHETTMAQLVADRMQLPLEDVQVVEGDSDSVYMGQGTFNSRSAQLGGSAAIIAADKVLDKAKRIAGHLLEVDPADVSYSNGHFGVVGDLDGPSASFTEVSQAAAFGLDIPPGEMAGLSESAVFDPPNYTAPFGTHMAVVEIDSDTGAITILRFVAVDDAGSIINPLLATGQVLGGVAQALGQALFEAVEYAPDGQPLSGSLVQYAVPRAHQLPLIESDHTATPTPVNPLGAKGIGESGITGAAPAVVNAVLDALGPLGVTHLDMPLTPPRVWRAIRQAGATVSA